MRILKIPYDDHPVHLEFSPDSRWLMAARHYIRLWAMPSGEERELGSGVMAARWAGAAILAVEYGSPCELRVLSPSGERIGQALFPDFTDNCMSASPAAGLVAVNAAHGGDGNLALRAWPGLKPLPSQGWSSGYLPDLRFSPDGTHLALIDSTPRVAVRTPAGQSIWEKDIPGHAGYGRLAWSPDGRFLAAASGIHLNIFIVATGERAAHLRLENKYYQDIAFTADGRFLAAVSNEKTVKVYETATWSLRHELAWSIGALKTLAFSPDGMLGAAGGKKKIVVWDIDW